MTDVMPICTLTGIAASVQQPWRLASLSSLAIDPRCHYMLVSREQLYLRLKEAVEDKLHHSSRTSLMLKPHGRALNTTGASCLRLTGNYGHIPGFKRDEMLLISNEEWAYFCKMKQIKQLVICFSWQLTQLCDKPLSKYHRDRTKPCLHSFVYSIQFCI